MNKTASPPSLEELVGQWHAAVWWSGIRPVLRRMLEADLTLAELIVLHALKHQALTIAQVAETLYITPSAASRAADRLVRDGLIARHENPADRRQKLLTLAAAGAALLSDVDELRARRIKRLMASLSARERSAFEASLTRVLEAFDATALDEDLDACPPRGPRRESRYDARVDSATTPPTRSDSIAAAHGRRGSP